MNRFAKFWHELRNPHCQHCLDELERVRNIQAEREACDSCHVLRLENARLIQENNRLLDRVLNPPKEEVTTPGTPVPIPRTHMPWRVRQQILEQEDRQAARAKNEAPVPITSPKDVVKEIEKVMGVD